MFMKKYIFYIKAHVFANLLGVVFALLLIGCQDSGEISSSERPTTVTLQVDVILPASLQAQWKNSIDWALANLQKAQQQCPQKVNLNLRFHDEDQENLGTLAFNLTHPHTTADTCHAIIGPYRSSNAQIMLPYTNQSNIPIILPTCSSTNLQRQQAKSTNTWLFTESDITQCEVMLTALGKDDVSTRVALIYSDDSYGESFNDWFGFLATEYKMKLASNGIHLYQKGENLQNLFADWSHSAGGEPLYVCVALSNVEDYQAVLSQLQPYSSPMDGKKPALYPICTDVAMNDELIQGNIPFYGVSPIADPASGFNVYYQAQFGEAPINGEAQIYDALTLIALGEAKALGAHDYVDRTLNGWMLQAVADQQGASANWTTFGLHTAFQNYAMGESCQLKGAMGKYSLDQLTHTKRIQTCYMFWKNQSAKVNPLGYYSASGTNGSTSISQIWNWHQQLYQDFDENLSANIPQEEATDHWALLVTPSCRWESYRHQADVFAMYQTLLRHGYDDDHILLITEDNLADAAENQDTPGKLYVDWGGEDVRSGALVDYHPSQLTVNDVHDILLGKSSEHLPAVFHTTNTSDIFIYWSGHGKASEGPLWSDADVGQPFGSAVIKDIVKEMYQQGKYRRMMLAVETCYSGLWGEALEGIPNVVIMTAANTLEPSKADIWDSHRQTYLSNAFTRAFRRAIEENPNITLRDLYFKLAQSTTGSHVSLYNESYYGSVYANGMGDYLTK